MLLTSPLISPWCLNPKLLARTPSSPSGEWQPIRSHLQLAKEKKMHCSQLLLKIEKVPPLPPFLNFCSLGPPAHHVLLVWDHPCKVRGTLTERKHFSTRPPASTSRLLSAQWDAQLVCESQATALVPDSSRHYQGFRLMLSLVYASSATASTPLVCFSVSLDAIFGVSHKMPNTTLHLLFFLTLCTDGPA